MPAALFYLIYRDFFVFQHDWRVQLDALLRGILAAAVLLVAAAAAPAMPFAAPAVSAFLQAALPEKVVLFLLLLFQRRTSLSASAASGAVAGLGFAFCENLIYGFSVHDSIVAGRLLSAVPVHLATSGLMGFYLGVMRYQTGTARIAPVALAFLLPFLGHALFDYLTLSNQPVLASIGVVFPLLVLLDVHLAYARSIPSPSLLASMGLQFPQWLIIRRQAQCERWILRSIASERADYPPVFRLKLDSIRVLLGVVFLLVLLLQGRLTFPFPEAERTAFFVTLPLLLLLGLAASGIFNPAYFRGGMLKIPIVMQAWFEGRPDQATAYGMGRSGVFLKTTYPYQPGDEVTLSFSRGRVVSPSVRARALWDNHKNLRQEFGTVFVFTAVDWAMFQFLMRLWFLEIGHGLAYFFKTPGYTLIRRLFVQPESVMHDLRYFPEGSVLVREGEPGDEFFMIKHGTVRITKEVGDTEQELALLGPGEIVGEMAIAGSVPRNATAVCVTNAVLTVADGRDLEDLVRNNPDFARAILHLTARRFSESSEALEAGLEAARADARLSKALMRAWTRILVDQLLNEKSELTLNLTHGLSGLDVPPSVLAKILQTTPKSIHNADAETLEAIWTLSRAKVRVRVAGKENGLDTGDGPSIATAGDS
ncbi:MAG: cyclic nucleotide-binding domain-containing protein [Spirochaetia bacterium]|nr:cyclic nucleotide-binding domain-containing protein [Spirochaetia bacterium]